MSLLKPIKNPQTQWQNAADEVILKASIRQPFLFGILIDRHQNSLFKTALAVVKHRQEAEDIVQETFTKIYFKANTFKKQPNASFKSWAYRIVLNTSFGYYRKLQKKKRVMVNLDPALYELLPDPHSEDFKKNKELEDIVSSTLAQMPAHLKSALSMYYLEGKSYANIATEEKTTISTIKMRIFRARRLFKKLLFLNGDYQEFPQGSPELNLLKIKE